jgi:hypothetical protein
VIKSPRHKSEIPGLNLEKRGVITGIIAQKNSTRVVGRILMTWTAVSKK